MKKNVLLVLLSVLYLNAIAQADNSNSIDLHAVWNPESIPTTTSGQKFNDIWGFTDCQSNEYAIIGSASMVHFVDITDPTNLVEIDRFEGGDTTTWRDIKTYQDRAYAVSDATTEGLMIFDMSQLPDSVSKTYHSNEFFEKAHNLFVDPSTHRLYVVGAPNADLLIFDLENQKDNPVLIGSLSLAGGYVHDIYVRDNIAYCSHLSAGLYIYDLTDAETPVTMGSLTEYAGQVFNHSSWLSEDGETLIFCDEKRGATVKALDVSDPTDLEIAASNEFSSVLLAPEATNSIAHNPYIRDNYAIVSYYHDGLQIFDISNRDSVVRVGYYDTHTGNSDYEGWKGVWGAYPFFPSGNIIASDMYNGLHVLSLPEINFRAMHSTLAPEAKLNIDGPIITCEGDSVTLEVANDGTHYLWYKDGELLDHEGHTITTNENGTYYVYVENEYCNSISNEVDLLFSIIPDLSMMPSGEEIHCPGDDVFLEAPAGFESYVWLKDGNALENSGNLIQIVSDGAYRLIATNGGCFTISDELIVDFVDVPSAAISNETSILCIDQTTTLSVEDGADEYSWYRDGELIIDATGNMIDTDEPGDYWVTINFDNCSRTSELVSILRDTPLTPVIQAEENVLSVNAEGFYQWYINGNLLQGANESTFTTPISGSYSVEVISAGGCTYTSEDFVLVLTDVEEWYNDQLTIFPNPVNEELFIQVSSDTDHTLNIKCTNLVGKQVFSHQESTSGESTINLHLPDMPSGIYLLEIDNGKKKMTRKIVKSSTR